MPLPGLLQRLFGRAQPGGALRALLAAAEEKAAARRQQLFGDIDVLQALLDDVDVHHMLTGAGADVERLKVRVQRFHATTTAVHKEANAAAPARSLLLARIIEDAEALAFASSRLEILPLDVLVTIARHHCPARTFLDDERISSVTLMQQICHGHLGENAGFPPPDVSVPEDERVAEIVLLNDDYTGMDFVVHVLQQLLGMGAADARTTMMKIHEEGHAACGVYFLDEARERVALINDYARRYETPLCAVLAKPA